MGSTPDVRRQPAHGNIVREAFRGDLIGLSDAADDVRLLLEHPGWAHVCRLLEVQVSDLDRKLDGALLPSRAEYAYDHGLRRGLGAAQGMARAIVSHAEQEMEKQRAKHEGAVEAALEAR